MELIKRLRRIKDGVIYPYSDAMAQSYGLEIVMCSPETGEVEEVIGEVGSVGVYGRRFVGTTLPEEESQARLKTPAKKPRAPRKKATAKKAKAPAFEIEEARDVPKDPGFD